MLRPLLEVPELNYTQASQDDAVQSLLDGKLNYDPNVMCNHHNHEEGHNCGSHSCGNKGCH